MSKRKLAEEIIRRYIEDLSDAKYRPESIDFFTGEGFDICSDMAGMSMEEKLRVMGLVKNLSGQGQRHSSVLKYPVERRQFSTAMLRRRQGPEGLRGPVETRLKGP